MHELENLSVCYDCRGYLWSFDVVQPYPHVVTTVPDHGATDVPIDTLIFARFDQDMDPSTLVSGNIALYDLSDGSLVPLGPEDLLDPDTGSVSIIPPLGT